MQRERDEGHSDSVLVVQARAYSPECVEGEFSEVGIAPVQHEGVPCLSDRGYWEG